MKPLNDHQSDSEISFTVQNPRLSSVNQKHEIVDPSITSISVIEHSSRNSLMNVFRFNAADLEINRNGLVSEHQLQKLTAENQKFGVYAGLLFISGILLTLFVPLLYPRSNGSLAIYIPALTAFGIGVIFVLKCSQIMRDRSEKVCGMVEGQITLKHGDYRGRNYYRIILPAIWFQVSDYEYYALSESRYRVYYTPHSRTILSIELLDQDAAQQP